MTEQAQMSRDPEPFDLEREPLDRPAPLDLDWGGDGLDLMRPVRAHVLAALPPATGPYAPPLDALLSFGDIEAAELVRRGDELGIGQAHVPELLRMLRDRTLATAYGDDPVTWAPMHALHLLARLDLSGVVPELLPLFDVDFDRLNDELIGIIGRSGATALAPLGDYLRDRTRWVWGRSRVASALEEIAKQHPELRDGVVTMLTEILTSAEDDHEIAITGVVGALVELKAVDALPLIRRAFELGRVDETMYGAWGDVLADLGGVPDPDDPLVASSKLRFDERNNRMFPPDLRERFKAFQERHREAQVRADQRTAARRAKQQKATKTKNKHKAASAARKANRKRRK